MTTIGRLTASSIALAVVLLFAKNADAVVVVDNLGALISGEASILGDNPSLSVATQFTTGPGAWQINTVTAKLADLFELNPDAMQIDVRNDNGGNPGATILGALNMTQNNVTTLGDYTYAPTAAMQLAGNTSYWLVAMPTFLDAQLGWEVTASPADNGVLGWSIGNLNRVSMDLGATWQPNGNEPTMFSIDATAVPEPGASMLALLAMAAVLRRRSAAN